MTTTLLSPQLRQLAHEVRDWSVDTIRPHARAADRAHRPPPEAKAAFDRAPFTGNPSAGAVEVDPARGIPERRYVTATVVTEWGIYGDILFTAANPGGGIGGKAVEVIGTPEQVERWAGGLARGEFAYSGFALTEPGAGSDAASLRTTARRDGDQWIINGTKMFCSGGALSDYVVVFATLDRELGYHGIRAFVVERGTPGFSVAKPNEDKLGCRAMLTSELVFDEVAVPLDHCIGDEHTQANAFALVLKALNTTRQQVAGMACGIAQASLDEGSALLRSQRKGFTTVRWDRIETDLAAMGAAIDRGRLLAYRAAWNIDAGLPFGREASMAKAYAPPTAERVCRRVIELLGADGWSEDLLFEKWYRDVKIMDIWEGTGQIHRRAMSRSLFSSPAGNE
jgi:alkylation response protein AidB-like acyl-CoA dehydrogenase